MKYNKKPLTFEEQADILISRGLIADRDFLISCLKAVNYYRITGYLYTFRKNNSDLLHDGTHFSTIWNRYTFDRRLRFLVMDAIERIEVSVRTRAVYYFAHTYGKFNYTNNLYFPHLSPTEHYQWLNKLEMETKRSREIFITHFNNKYGNDHAHLPIWVLAEIMSFGSLLKMYNGLHAKMKRKLAGVYKIPDKVLTSWLLAIYSIRNICAHHGRLWNKELCNKPLLPSNKNKYPEWQLPINLYNHTNRVFIILTILNYLLKIIAPQSRWSDRFLCLLNEYKDIPIKYMGFPDNWKTCPIWKPSDMENK